MQGSYTRQFTAWLESCQQAFLFLFCVLTWLIFRITSYLTAWRFHGECQWQPFIQEDLGLTSETLKNCSCSWWTWSAVPLLGCIGRIWWCSLHLNWAWNNTWVGRIVLAVLKAACSISKCSQLNVNLGKWKWVLEWLHSSRLKNCSISELLCQ